MGVVPRFLSFSSAWGSFMKRGKIVLELASRIIKCIPIDFFQVCCIDLNM